MLGRFPGCHSRNARVPSVPDDVTPTFDVCPICGREGRTRSVANLSGVTGAGDRVLPLRGLELEIATHVGAATIAAGELDAAMGALHVMTGTVSLDGLAKTWGRSGTALTCELRRLFADSSLNEADSKELKDVCDQYDVLYASRNRIIHSFRPGHDNERLDIVMPIKSTRARPVTTAGQMFERQRMGLGELIDLYYDLDNLTHRARALFLKSVGRLG